MDSSDKNKVTFEVMNVENLNNCLNVVKALMNKGVKNGTYELTEVEQILVCLSSLYKGVSVLDKYQKYVESKVKEAESKNSESE